MARKGIIEMKMKFDGVPIIDGTYKNMKELDEGFAEARRKFAR